MEMMKIWRRKQLWLLLLIVVSYTAYLLLLINGTIYRSNMILWLFLVGFAGWFIFGISRLITAWGDKIEVPKVIFGVNKTNIDRMCNFRTVNCITPVTLLYARHCISLIKPNRKPDGSFPGHYQIEVDTDKLVSNAPCTMPDFCRELRRKILAGLAGKKTDGYPIRTIPLSAFVKLVQSVLDSSNRSAYQPEALKYLYPDAAKTPILFNRTVLTVCSYMAAALTPLLLFTKLFIDPPQNDSTVSYIFFIMLFSCPPFPFASPKSTIEKWSGKLRNAVSFKRSVSSPSVLHKLDPILIRNLTEDERFDLMMMEIFSPVAKPNMFELPGLTAHEQQLLHDFLQVIDHYPEALIYHDVAQHINAMDSYRERLKKFNQICTEFRQVESSSILWAFQMERLCGYPPKQPIYKPAVESTIDIDFD